MISLGPMPPRTRHRRRHRLGPPELDGPDWPRGSVIYTDPDEPNLRVVHELNTENDDPEMHFTVLVVEGAD